MPIIISYYTEKLKHTQLQLCFHTCSQPVWLAQTVHMVINFELHTYRQGPMMKFVSLRPSQPGVCLFPSFDFLFSNVDTFLGNLLAESSVINADKRGGQNLKHKLYESGISL